MKVFIAIARIIVGLLFIFSGLIKANDPLGLSYKMQEFFELWGWTNLNHLTLSLSVLMIAFEIIAGIALLLGWRMRLFGWLLLLLIIFFTFLTGYAFLSGKFKNCGCFGDCLPITSLTSFIKDVALTLLIVFLFAHRRKVRSLFGARLTLFLMVVSIIFSFAAQWYTLQYLPVFDCLAYKKGNNISEKMKIPPGSMPDSFAIRFVYQKEGKSYEFAPSDLPADLSTYQYMSRTDKLVRAGNAEPPIKGFSLYGISEEDSTEVVLSQPYAVLLFSEDFATPLSAWEGEFGTLYSLAVEKHIPVYFITNKKEEATRRLAGTPFAGIQLFTCDYTAIRTAARTNPCVYLLQRGTIVDKQSYKRISRITTAVSSLPVQPVATPNP